MLTPLQLNQLPMLKKAAIFSDIHFGRKSNSPQHNMDCIAFIDWFCDEVRADPTIDHVMFLGDWFENRSALSVNTIGFSVEGAEKLNSLGIPVYFCVGNHDLFHRHTRDVYSTVMFRAFSNFIIINEPTVVNDIQGGALLAPFLFPAEYDDIKQYLHLPLWAGHFEFKDFVVTGYNVKMPTGPNPTEFTGPRHILCGHFHKRQTVGNITYVGNTFPMDFGDAGDIKRGMAIITHSSHKLEFRNWGDCPQYVKMTLSDLLDDSTTIPANARIKCVVDVPITFEESNFIKDSYTDKFGLREFAMEESGDIDEALTNTRLVGTAASMGDTVDELVITMLSAIKSDHIDSEKLITIYQGLQL